MNEQFNCKNCPLFITSANNEGGFCKHTAVTCDKDNFVTCPIYIAVCLQPVIDYLKTEKK